ncbi:PREDICTED: histone-lysine N-methyltransferase, H3 lysine-9 specific SUVH6-like isoform X1 [Lupinus angustifolius]|nr:PREDICTED: histone-lysine N-methyltransferase, H3 lysine-9 specific SUVH6-like isoform X1 [Lupinus angustifolius]
MDSNPGNNLFVCEVKAEYIYPLQTPLSGSLIYWPTLFKVFNLLFVSLDAFMSAEQKVKCRTSVGKAFLYHSRGMTASLNIALSEERFGKRSIENGDCTSLTRSMYKRRKLSANRDFPEGCGPLASNVDPVSKVDVTDFVSANGTNVEDKNEQHSGDATVRISKCEDDSQHSVLKKDSILTESLRQTTDCSLKNKNPEVASHYADGLPLANDVSTKVASVGAEAMEDTGLTLGQITDCNLKNENPVRQTADHSLKNEDPVVASHHVNGLPLANDDPAKVLVGVDALEDTGLTGVANSVKCMSSMPKSPSPVDGVALSGGSKSCCNGNVSGSSDCIKKAMTTRYAPLRKLSAVRDFPPLCGRNAPRLGKDEHLNKISLDSKIPDQQNLAVDDNPLKKITATDVQEKDNNIQEENACKRKLVDVGKADSESSATKKVKKMDAFEHPQESNQVVINFETAIEEENQDAVQDEGASGLAIIACPEVQSPEAKPLDMSTCQHELKGDFSGLQVSSNRKVVLGLMSKPECLWRSDKDSSISKTFGDKNGSKAKKGGFSAHLDRSKATLKCKDAPNQSGQKPLKKKKENAASDDMGQLVVFEKDSLDLNENIEDFQVVPKSHGFNVNVPPFGHGNFGGHENDSTVTRNKVRETLRLFQVVSRKILQQVEGNSKGRANNSKRVDLQASKILKEKGKYVNTGKQILGSVPGVEVGDEFQYRVELNMIGLHRQSQSGIDYLKHNGKILATSIVASGGYADDLDNSNVLIYTGQGGNVMSSDKEPEDQKLERGNLALKNSSEEKNPVRVIRGYGSMDGRPKTLVYDGLYLVESYWQDMGPHGKLVYKFRLRRIPGQPELALKEVKKSKKFKTREGLCVDDISHGKERIPVCAVNTVDDEKPPSFKYITSMIYPDGNLTRHEGCDCTNGCSDSNKCSCVVENGGEIPFNHNGAIVEAKPLVYECGPSCKCPSTCHNRVSQLGIKFQLEIFKTSTRGWGVRSLNSIPSGSFICEYIGELLEDKEAEQRTSNDEYLFDIGNNFTNSTLWDGLSTLMPDAQSSSLEVVKDGGFTIDAAEYGNVGRFINHSCSPNLYAQNVLYDHDDKGMPHIMLFAAENIPPLQELTYDYNYKIDQVFDSDGNIKRKDCYCGSVECTGRMY